MLDAEYAEKTAVEWAEAWVRDHRPAGPAGTGKAEMVRQMPWSTVYRLDTADGWLYLKVPAPVFAVDGPLMMFLKRELGAAVPEVVACHLQTHAFLMRDCGRPLREILMAGMDRRLLCRALRTYADLQLAAASRKADILALGVPDWSSVHLPNLFQALLDSGLLEQSEDMSVGEISRLRDLMPYIRDIGQQLESAGIPASLEHADFQDNNLLVAGERVVVSDFGDAIIAHPFFSLTRFLESFARVHPQSATPEFTETARTSYLEAWYPAYGEDDVRRAYGLVEGLSSVKYALCFSRLWTGLPQAELVRYQGWMAGALRVFLAGADPA